MKKNSEEVKWKEKPDKSRVTKALKRADVRRNAMSNETRDKPSDGCLFRVFKLKPGMYSCSDLIEWWETGGNDMFM